ncbi:hypothetical protein FSARC_11492 [Fusarium sarcochroum]|uniref:Zn(2)-C6 fungal-type domain-containing protein n=1 Tax=Fusarium sarcochroum TaxID=1208366 RepID=A0A8H4TF54_9HYPO|nr:hypothetical protein FSARC_11492 [Fusarium sarcochroum]
MLQTNQNTPNNSRTSTQKVRTGCITCKKRHIKCDETKPHCSNCLKIRGHCEGYALNSKKKVTGSVQLRWNVGKGTSKLSSKVAIQLQVHPDSVDFQDATAHLYFQEFVGLVQGPWLNAVAQDDLWRVTLPQLARSNDIFRSAAIAIGALSLWHRHSGCRSLRSVSVPVRLVAQKEKHYFHAVTYYCQSLKLQNQRASPQDAVFLSLLLLFFESLRGNRQAVLDHINHGLTLLLTLLTDENAQSLVATLAPNPKPFLAAVANVFTQLSTQVRTVIRGRVAQGPSLPNLTNELRRRSHSMEAFMCRLSQLSGSPEKRQTPAAFKSLDDFEEYWASSSYRQTKIISIMADVLQQSTAKDTGDQDAIDDFFSELLGNTRIQELCKDSQKELQLLNAAFLPLFNRIVMTDAESPAYLRALHLRLKYLACYAIENPINYFDSKMLQSQTPFFREFLSLADAALRTANRASNNPAFRLSLQCDLSWQLFNVAMLCRDPLTRDDAIRLLRDYPGQDGLWNTTSLYLLALRNRDIERMNAQEGTPVEQWWRLRRREFVFEDGGNRILLRYLDKNQGTSSWQVVEEVAEVRPDFDTVEWVRQPLSGSGGLLLLELYSS